MNEDEIKGKAKNLAGRAQESIGELGGDTRHQVEGLARQVAGRAQEGYGEVRDFADDTAKHVGHWVDRQPLTALLVVGAVGVVLGALMMRR